jgi:hypothetical protein
VDDVVPSAFSLINPHFFTWTILTNRSGLIRASAEVIEQFLETESMSAPFTVKSHLTGHPSSYLFRQWLSKHCLLHRAQERLKEWEIADIK